MNTGIFGSIHIRYKRKGQKAVNFLNLKKEGEVPEAIFHNEIGWIDLVWGIEGTRKSDGFGLSKIAKYHPSVISQLEKIIKSLRVTQSSENRYKLENKEFVIVISRVWFETKKTWLLTAFEKKNP